MYTKINRLVITFIAMPVISIVVLMILMLWTEYLVSADGPYTYDDLPAAPIPIGDAFCGSSQVTRTFTVVDNFTVNYVQVGFNADHAYRGDINAWLESPTGTSVQIITGSWSDGNENYDIFLDEASMNPLDDGTADNTAAPFYDREVGPGNPLSAFVGENSAGQWNLSICDSWTLEDPGTYNHSRLILWPTGSPVLVASKNVNNRSIVKGQVLTYTVVLQNVGSIDATGAMMADPLPSGVVYVPNSLTTQNGSPATFGGNTISWNGTVTAGQSITFTLQATVTASSGRITNMATISHSSLSEPLVRLASNRVLPDLLTFVEVHKDGIGGDDGLGNAHSVKVSGDGKHVYVASPTDDAVGVFGRDSSTGKLTFIEKQRAGTGPLNADGAYWVAISPDDNHVYTADYDEDMIVVFSRNAATGRLTLVEQQQDGVNGVDGLDGAIAVIVSPDGKHVYAAGAQDNAVAVFSRNATTGALTFVERIEDASNLAAVYAVAISPDGQNVYAGSLAGDKVVVFSRNATNGRLSWIQIEDSYSVRALTVSPDGQHVYVASIAGDYVDVYQRNPTTGLLTFVEYQGDNKDDVESLNGPHGVIVSPDGQYVVVASYFDNALTAFRRNTTTGRLDLVDVDWDGMNGVDGLDWATSVIFSPDGRYVYATSAVDNAVVVFSRPINLVHLPIILKQ